MTLFGHVQDGRIVFEPPVLLPEGVQVRVEVVVEPNAVVDESSIPTLAERFANVIGAATDLPTDLAEQHDHYRHGTPKR